jgi:hypothetical protein
VRALTKRLQDPNVLVMWFALVGTVLAPICMLCFGQAWVPLTGSLVWLEACVGKPCVRVACVRVWDVWCGVCMPVCAGVHAMVLVHFRWTYRLLTAHFNTLQRSK